MKAFISSTYADLVEHRQMAAQALERLGHQAIRMEIFGARPGDPTTVCRAEIEEAELFIGIYAHRYGYIPPGESHSITELEYKLAQVSQKPIFCFFVNNDYPWKPSLIDGEPSRSKLEEFKAGAEQSLVRDVFTTPDDLAFKISASLGRYLISKTVKDTLDQASYDHMAGSDRARSQVSRRAARLATLAKGARILLVNDLPYEMEYVVSLYETLSINVTIATTSEQALSLLAHNAYDLIVSDMRRGDIVDEGARFLIKMHEQGFDRPAILTLARYDPSRGTPAFAFGITNEIDELLNLTFDILERCRG